MFHYAAKVRSVRGLVHVRLVHVRLPGMRIFQRMVQSRVRSVRAAPVRVLAAGDDLAVLVHLSRAPTGWSVR